MFELVSLVRLVVPDEVPEVVTSPEVMFSSREMDRSFPLEIVVLCV